MPSDRRRKGAESPPKKATASASSRTSKSADEALIVVGIGSSAGGLEALRAVLPSLPPKANIAYVIAQHMDPKHRSMMVDLLKSDTPMDVVEAKNRQHLRAGVVYITPPGQNVTVANEQIRLTKATGLLGPKPSVDQLFASLAEDRAEKAVGIVLSGTGSDGAMGVRAIKASGGLTIAQAVESAKFDGMPHAAISTGNVDLTLRPERVGQELLQLLAHPVGTPLTLAENEQPNDVQRILRTVQLRTGCDFSDYKASTVNRRIQRRMTIHKLVNLGDYVEYLELSPNEARDLCRDILLSVTGFFRDRGAFEALENTLRQILDSKRRGDSIRIWVPGCATGEEAYSIAILLNRLLGSRRNDYFVQIFSTDLDEDAILHARNGVYSAASLTNVPAETLDAYFVARQNMYQVAKSIRDMVVFARQDLVRDPPFSHLDLVSCRNLLIYFNSRLQERVLSLFHQVIDPNGYLFLGRSESIVKFGDLFKNVDSKWRIFQRRADGSRAPRERDLVPFRGSFGAPLDNRRAKPARPLRDVMNQAISDAYAACAVLVDDQMQVRHVRGDVSSYLRLGTGDVDLKVISMARDEVRQDLRTLLYRSIRDNKALRSRRLRLGDGLSVTLHAQPIGAGDEHGRLTAVLFEAEHADPAGEAEVPVVDSTGDSRIQDLEKELFDTREQLQTTVEELETTNEELQSTNEELQTANEELQSANEELETSNEELQSTNEELRTVNEELHVKSDELQLTNADLENILSSVRFPLVVVDQALRITRATQAAVDLCHLPPLDTQPVFTSVPCKLQSPSLKKDLTQVMEQQEPIERELRLDGSVYRMRVLPYHSERADLAGAVLMLLDETAIRTAEETLRRRENRLSAILDNYLYGIITIDEHGRVQEFNKAAERIFGYSAAEVVGNSVGLLMPEPQRTEHQEHIERYLRTGESHIIGTNRAVIGLRKNGAEITMDLALSEIIDGDSRSFVALLHAHEDTLESSATP